MQKGSSAADEEQTRVQVKVRGGYLRSPPRRAEKADSVISGADSPVRFLPRYYILLMVCQWLFLRPHPRPRPFFTFAHYYRMLLG